MDLFSSLCFLISIITVMSSSGSGSSTRLGGMKTRITQRAIDFFTESGQIKSMLPDIPDISDSTEISVLGKVDYRVYGIEIQSLELFPRSFLTVEPDVGLKWQANELNIALKAKWSYDTHSLIPLSDSGKVTVDVTVKSEPFKLKLSADEDGRLEIKQSSSGCHFSVSKVDIELSGGKEWLYNLFETKVEDMIKEAANDQICAMIGKVIREDLAAVLSTMEVIAPLVPDVAHLDLSLSSNPEIDSYIDLFHKGDVFDVANDEHGDFEEPTLPSDTEEERMIYMWLTDYVLNSAGYALESSDYLQYTVTQAEIPEDSSFILNTSSYEISLLLPQVSRLYPNLEVQCSIALVGPPSFKLTGGGVSVSVVTNIDLIVLGDNSPPSTLITLENNMEMSLVLGVRDTSIIWDVQSFSCETSLIATEVEGFDFVIVESAIKFACHALIKQYIKDMGVEGVSLPELPGDLALINPSVVHGEGHVRIAFDLSALWCIGV